MESDSQQNNKRLLRKKYIKTIDIIEKRLYSIISNNNQLIDILNENKLSRLQELQSCYEDSELFPIQSICLYFKILGEVYYKLVPQLQRLDINPTANKMVEVEYIKRCIKAFKSAYILAILFLDNLSTLKLQCIFQYCFIMNAYIQDNKKIYRIASKAIFSTSNLIFGDLPNNVIILLESIRRTFMLHNNFNLKMNEMDSSQASNAFRELYKWQHQLIENNNSITIWNLFINDEYDEDYEEETDFDDNYDDDLNNELMNILNKKRNLYNKSNNNVTDPNMLLVNNLRLQTTLSSRSPILLETFPSSSEIIYALDKIFRKYRISVINIVTNRFIQ